MFCVLLVLYFPKLSLSMLIFQFTFDKVKIGRSLMRNLKKDKETHIFTDEWQINLCI